MITFSSLYNSLFKWYYRAVYHCMSAIPKPTNSTSPYITHESSHTHVYQTSNVFQGNSSRSQYKKMASESENRDADSASTSDPPYYYVRDFYTLSYKVSDSKNLTFLFKLCPPQKLAIIKKKKVKMN